MRRSLVTAVGLGVAFAATMGVARGTGQSGPTTAVVPPGADGPHLVGVLDLVRIFDGCAQINDLNDMIRRRTEEITKEAEQRRDVIDNKRVELTAFQPGKPDYEVRRKDLVRLNIEANVWFKAEEEEVERLRFRWTRVIYEQAVKAAAEVARERGYTAVLQRRQFKPFAPGIDQNVQALRRMIQERTVVYNVPEVDITDLVVRRLDAAYKAGGGKKQLGAAAPPAP